MEFSLKTLAVMLILVIAALLIIMFLTKQSENVSTAFTSLFNSIKEMLPR